LTPEAIKARGEAEQAKQQVEGFFERFKQSHQRLSSARTHADAGRWSEAAAEFQEAAELQPDYYLVWLERASFYIRLGLWDRAAADFGEALNRGAPDDGPSWHGVPQLQWFAGDRQHHQEYCDRIVMTVRSSPGKAGRKNNFYKLVLEIFEKDAMTFACKERMSKQGFVRNIVWSPSS
jgi:tetratricopeptide (TPR) repeat protein